MAENVAGPGSESDPQSEIEQLKQRLQELEGRFQAESEERSSVSDSESRRAALSEGEEHEVDLPVEELPDLNPEHTQAAERLIREARVARIRKQNDVALQMLRQAETIAPNSPIVLEALGDEYVERRQNKNARELYKRALKMDPKNVGLERKYANLVFNLAQAEGSSVVALLESNSYANPKAAMYLTILFPGVGQMVNGDYFKGGAMLAGWVTGVAIASSMGGVTLLMSFLGLRSRGGVPSTSSVGMAFLVVAFCFWLWALLDMAASSAPEKKKIPAKRGLDRPAPPREGGGLPYD